MKIYIPTLGRATRQATLNHLPPALRKKTTLVVQKEDHANNHQAYDNAECGDIIVLPAKIRNLPDTLQFLTEQIYKRGEEKFAIVHDDLRFDTRRKDDRTKFTPATDKDIIQLFKAVEKSLDKYAHVGLLAREGGNRQTDFSIENNRMMRFLCYQTETFMKEKIKWNRFVLPEDFDVTLQLLYKGYKNLVICEWVHGQAGSNVAGGCSEYRTIQLHNENMKKFAAVHEGFVKLVEKQTKTSWGGHARMDVMVQWKKAYESSMR